MDSAFDGIDFNMAISRAKFEELNADLFRSTIEPVERVLRDAKIAKADVHEVPPPPPPPPPPRTRLRARRGARLRCSA